MNTNTFSLQRSVIYVLLITLLISIIPYISSRISPQTKMLHPPSLFIYFSEEPVSARDLYTRNGKWEIYNGKRLKNRNQYAYLWLEFPRQESEKEIVHVINNEQNYYTELLKPGRLCAITLYKQGDRIPASKSPFKQSKTVFPLSLSPDSPESFIMEYNDPRGVIIDLDFVDPEIWFSSVLSEKTTTGFITGIILALLIYCGYLAIHTKDSIPLSFAFLIVTHLFLYAGETRILLEHIDPLVYPPWLFPFSVALNIEAHLFFIRTVFKKNINARMQLIITGLAILTLLSALASFFVRPLQLGNMLTLISLSLYLVILQPLIHAIRNKNAKAIIPLLAIFPLLATKLIDMVIQTISLGESFFKNYQILFAITTSLILYSILQNKIDKNVSKNISIEHKKRIPEKSDLLEFSVGALTLPDSICIFEQKKGRTKRIAQILNSIGYSPDILFDRVEVLEKASTNTIDLLIINSNINSEEMVSICKLIRHQHLKQNLPILVITEDESSIILTNAMTSGVNDFLTPPFTNAEFVIRVKSLLRLKALSRINTNLSRSESEKNAFLYFLTHNVNTPLTILINRIQELRRENNSKEMEEIVEDLEISASEINDIVQNVLISFRISDNKHILRIENFNLHNSIDRMYAILLKKAQIKKQKLKWIDPDILPSISADKTAIKGILYNIIDNAIKFTPKHGFIRVEIIVSHLLSIEISDSGPGIEEESLKDLFLPFQSLSSKPTGGESSTGLGLYVARELSLMSGATLTCLGENKANSTYPGAKFILTLHLSHT